MTSANRNDQIAARQLAAIEAIAACETLEATTPFLSQLLEEMHLERCRLAIVAPRPHTFEVVGSVRCAIGNRILPDAGRVVFSREDPMVDEVFVKGLPTLWLPFVDGRKAESDRARELWAECEQNGLSVMSPIGGGWMTSLCVIAQPDEEALSFEARAGDIHPTLRIAAAAAAHPARNFIVAKASQALTQSEREILLKISQGLRPIQIAQQRGTAEPTVRNQIVALRQKLAAKSTPHAVAIAIQNGLI
ncbi:MAG: helix-turn-helix transcriptional regulator [Pseudomonadota bacterium]